MWKRPDEAASPSPASPTPGAQPQPQQLPSLPPSRTTGGSSSHLGPSLAWEGKLSGDEDLLVEGQFRGEIQLPAHSVTIGGAGKVEGEVRANAIVVEGEVRGNLHAAQQVLVRATGRVLGDIRAPRVALDQGCRFKGAIDMEPGTAGRGEAADQRREARGEKGAAEKGASEKAASEKGGERITEPPVARETQPSVAR
jgi:cytoskeletal protein CcmA (bactofilin family)